MVYKMLVTDTNVSKLYVEAESIEDAKCKALEAYNNGCGALTYCELYAEEEDGR